MGRCTKPALFFSRASLSPHFYFSFHRLSAAVEWARRRLRNVRMAAAEAPSGRRLDGIAIGSQPSAGRGRSRPPAPWPLAGTHALA